MGKKSWVSAGTVQVRTVSSALPPSVPARNHVLPCVVLRGVPSHCTSLYSGSSPITGLSAACLAYAHCVQASANFAALPVLFPCPTCASAIGVVKASANSTPSARMIIRFTAVLLLSTCLAVLGHRSCHSRTMHG